IGPLFRPGSARGHQSTTSQPTARSESFASEALESSRSRQGHRGVPYADRVMSWKRLWPLKITAKVLLSRLPIPYHAWRRVSLFKHGDMRDPAYALSVMRRHIAQAGFAPSQGWVGLELGPGDSIGSAL